MSNPDVHEDEYFMSNSMSKLLLSILFIVFVVELSNYSIVLATPYIGATLSKLVPGVIISALMAIIFVSRKLK